MIKNVRFLSDLTKTVIFITFFPLPLFSVPLLATVLIHYYYIINYFGFLTPTARTFLLLLLGFNILIPNLLNDTFLIELSVEVPNFICCGSSDGHTCIHLLIYNVCANISACASDNRSFAVCAFPADNFIN